MLIKIGRYILNTAAIALIDLDATSRVNHSNKGIRIELTSINATSIGESSASQSQTLFFKQDTSEHDAILKYFTAPDHVIDLMPDEETYFFQDYRDRGGTMLFEDWSAKLRKHQELCKIENLSDRQRDLLCQLESELLH